MEVILKQDIEKLGKADSIVKVKDGYARNFLIPKGLAVPLATGDLKRLEQEKQKKILQLEKAKKRAQELAQKLLNLSLTIPVLTKEEDKLYGSIGSIEISRALKEEGFDINKNFIVLDEPIRSLGIYEVPIKLHPEVLIKMKVWVVKK